MNKINNERGYALLLVIVLMSILIMLGLTLASYSIVNIKGIIINKNEKTALYLSEAGLEETYNLMGQVIKDAIGEANEEVKNQISDFIDNERLKEQKEPEQGQEAYDSPYIIGRDGGGLIHEENLKDKMNQLFKPAFTSYINENMKNAIEEKVYTVVDSQIEENESQISIINEELYHEENSLYSIKFQSRINHKGIEKIIESIFSIEIPPYDGVYYTTKRAEEIHDNILYHKAISTNKNIFINGNVNIIGDIYAYGTRASNEKNTRDFGGIVIGKEVNGNLTIDGDMVTNSYIHMNHDNSHMELNNGNIYCDTLLIQRDVDNSSIRINNGVVNTLDDLELNGTNSHININGSYYGFSDGSSNPVHNNSSSIVINSGDIGQGSTLTITGEELKDSNYEKGVYIAGTGYISSLNDNGELFDYQTGESLSIRGNYKAYSRHLKDDENLYSDMDITKRKNEFKPENIEFSNYEPLVLIKRDLLNTAKKKSLYFKYYSEDYTPYSDIPFNRQASGLNLGGMGISINNIRYKTGALISEGNVYEGDELGSISEILINKERDYSFFINKMGDPIYLTNNEANKYKDIHMKVNIEDRFVFSENLIPDTPEKLRKINEEKEIIFINDDESKTVTLIGPGGETYESGLNINLEKNNIKGIIVTKGDVRLRGRLNYKGIIVAKGNVFIEGSEEKSLVNDHETINNYLLPKIYATPVLKAAFEENLDNNKRGTLISFIGEESVEIDENHTYTKYKDIIKKQWKEIK